MHHRKQIEEIIQMLNDRNETVSTAESLTAGGLSQMLTSVSGSSTAFVGGLTAYRNEIKIQMLGVNKAVIDKETVVSESVAMEMAKGALQKFSTTWAIATTGVAGPDPLEGHAPGEVWIAIAGPMNQTVQLNLDGTRDVIREATVASAIGTFARILKYRGV